MSDTVLDVRNLQVQFATDEKQILAVDGISFKLEGGQTLGIVGESGSGKSVTSLGVMGLVPSPGKIISGEIWFKSQASSKEKVNLLNLTPEELRSYRGGQISMIFQEPMSSLNPVFTCGYQLVEAIRQHQDVSEKEAKRQAIAHLQEVKLLPSDEELRKRYLEENEALSEAEVNRYINQEKLAILDRYPHELSGGQLQRIMIAMAISCNPAILIADEPTTALDVTVQATILDLLRELRDARGMSMMFIAHDLGVIAEIADTVAVMYRGKIVEYGTVEQIFSNPHHPYTKGLLACRPSLNRRVEYLPTVSDFMEVVTTPSGEIEIREKPVNREIVDSNEPLTTTAQGSPLIVNRNDPSTIVGQSSSFIVNRNEPSTTNHQQSIRMGHASSFIVNNNEPPTKNPILQVRDLQVGFPIKGMFGQTQRYTMAVNGVSFDVYSGETLGLVGESGCGKSTLARTLLRLIEPMSGQVIFENQDIINLSGKYLRQLRREMQIVFQNPYSSLDPRLKIGEAVIEPLRIHGYAKTKKECRDRATYLLERVGLNPILMNRYPHEFSGGQRQRVCIARALALNPKFIICDESVSALDVSVQAQVLNLLKELQSEFGLTYIFISHDLSVVKFMSDRIMVMNTGKIVEIGSSESLYREPQQEYTQKLIAAIPTGSLEQIQQRQQQRTKVSGISEK